MKQALVFLLLTGAVISWGKTPKKKDDSARDRITVVGHIPLTGGPVTRFIATRHYSSSYVYAEHESGKTLTLIDVTNSAHPVVLAEVPMTSGTGDPSLLAAAGTAALVSDSPAVTAKPDVPQTIRIMDFSNPSHPTVGQEFRGITAISKDAQPGLILIANAEGIWILQQHLAEDPAIEKSYEYKVLYGDR